jgi:glycerophosphoryl diester phosphodiesterase
VTPRPWFFFVALAAALPCAAEPAYHHDINARECCVVIAHAAGGIEGNPYTNSEEAMLANLKTGVRVFEVDFARTEDGVWVGTHDWALWKSQTRHEGRLPPTYRQFKASKLKPLGAASGPYTGLTIPFLERTLARYQSAIIITDTKYELEDLARALKETRLFRRVYPQAYSPRDVDMLAGLGYERIILTGYKMDLGRAQRFLDRVAPIAGKLHALTVPFDFFAKHHAQLTKLGLPIYVHGPPESINSRELHHRFRQLGVAGFYLD